MTTKTIFNMDTKLKFAAMKKARAQGMTLSSILNLATQSFVNGDLRVGLFEKELVDARDDVRKGRVIPQEKLFKKFGV